MVGVKGNANAADAVPQEIDLLLKQECLAGLELDTCSMMRFEYLVDGIKVLSLNLLDRMLFK